MSKKFIVTPWKVEGDIDYNKLIKQFGTEKISDALLKKIKKHTKELHIMLRRGFFFSHRDLNKVLDAYEEGKKFYLYTGRGPSNKMHIGHLVPIIFTQWMQKKFNVNTYVQITDDEKFLFNQKLSLKETNKYGNDNILDIIACGFNPDKTFIFKNTEYIKHLYKMSLEVSKRINFSNVKAVFGFKNETNIGSIFFPAVQAAPAFFEKNICLIPSAIDQDNFWRGITRHVAPKLSYLKSAAIHSKFLPSLKGPAGKMSASEKESAIWLDDNPKTVSNKIKKYAFSGGQPNVKEHREKGGNPDIDVSYQWLSILFESNDKKLKKIHDDYLSGKLLTSELKEILIEKINSFLKNHQKQKKKAIKLRDKFMYNGKLARKMWEIG